MLKRCVVSIPSRQMNSSSGFACCRQSQPGGNARRIASGNCWYFCAHSNVSNLPSSVTIFSAE
ncbi:hypothetical protein ACSPAH_00370 [Buttiauxella agrestis]